MNEIELLNTISKKLDRMIALTQIGLRKELDALRDEIKKDEVSLKILEYTDGVLSASDLHEKVVKTVGVSERTVKRRLSELADKSLLISNRDGKSIYYVNSGILEV